MDLGDGRLRRRLVALFAGMLAGCGPGDRYAADLQLDVVGAQLSDTDRIRICIEDALIYETTVGDGRIALAGLPLNGVIDVNIDSISDEKSTGQAEPTSFDNDEPWKTTNWKTCDTSCAPCNIENPEPQDPNNNTRMLAIHFID